MKKILHAIFVLVVVILSLSAVSANEISGSDKKKSPKVYRRAGKVVKKRKNVSPSVRTGTPVPVPVVGSNLSPQTDIPAVPQIKPVEENYKGFEAKNGVVEVDVNSNGNMTARLGLSPRGVITIEFPADDPIYSIFSGDSSLIEIFCRNNEKNECRNDPTAPIVLMPTKEFHNWGDADTTTIVTVQRQSGISVTFFVVPVRSIAQNSNHVVVKYKTADVVKNRISSGLVTNLGKNTLAASNNEGLARKGLPTASAGAPAKNGLPDEAASKINEDEIKENAVQRLQSVSNLSGKLSFSKPVHGLSLAVANSPARVRDVAIDVIAVRNTLKMPVKLIADDPALFVETVDGGKRISSENLNILHTATNADDDYILRPGETYYFAVAYRVPVLGSKQFLRVSFSQTNASDEPATALLGSYAR